MDTKELDLMLAAMVRAGASSLHLIPGQRPCIRVQRRFVQSEHDVLVAAAIDELTRDLMFADHRQRLSRNGQVDVLYVARTGQRFRTTVFRQETGVALLFRPVPESPPQLSELELPPHFAAFVDHRQGLVLISGCSGSGKSTTMAALVDRFNGDTLRHVVTLEDPIEYVHPQKLALLHQREIGPHVRDFETGIRQAMRLAADVIFVSDLRDGQTLAAALDAVESGCLVFVGYEASSVVSACMELPMLMPPELRQATRLRLANALRAVTAQTLLPCAHHQGRVPMVEILINNDAVRTAIRQGADKDLPAIMTRCRGLGMQTIDQALRQLLARHVITQEEAIQHATSREAVSLRLASAPAMARV